MPRMDILSAVECEEFDSPPLFTLAQQQQYFEPSLPVIRALKRLKTPTNQVYFLLAYGYFLATSRFFTASQFRPTDIRYVSQELGVSLKLIHPHTYAHETQARHRQRILRLCQFRAWNRAILRLLQPEAQTLAQLYWEPRQIFFRLVEWLVTARIAVPRSAVLSPIVATALTRHRQTLARQVGEHISPLLRESLLTLIVAPPQPQRGIQYRLTQLKRLSQSTKLAKVRARLEDLTFVRMIYEQTKPLLHQLQIPQAGIVSYAQLTLNLAPFDLIRRPEHDRVLHLLAFVVHHYARLQDNLADVFLQVFSSMMNSVRREHMAQYYATRDTHAMSLTALLTLLETNVLTAFKAIQRIVESSTLTSDEKVQQIQQLFVTQQTSQQELTQAMTPLKSSVEDTQKHATYDQTLERRSLRLQFRLMPILKSLAWAGTDHALDRDTVRARPPRHGGLRCATTLSHGRRTQSGEFRDPTFSGVVV